MKLAFPLEASILIFIAGVNRTWSEDVIPCVYSWRCPEPMQCIQGFCNYECTSDDDCPKEKHYCTNNRCKECTDTAHCPAMQVCATGTCKECVDLRSMDICKEKKYIGECANPMVYKICRRTCGCESCLSNPCKNNGTCMAQNTGYVKCICHGSHVGLRCEYQDAYRKLDRSHCLRREQRELDHGGFYDIKLDVNHAKEGCSKNKRCVGIEGAFWVADTEPHFYLCLDSIYTSTAYGKYKETKYHLYKKLDNYAFPQDFIRHENSASCKENSPGHLKVFKIPHFSLKYKISNSVAAFECELYCASTKTCWGCLNICNKTCQWNAITNCERKDSTKDPAKQISSTKPVCFDVQLNIAGETQEDNRNSLLTNAALKWELGSCSSLNSIEKGATYQYPAVYTERCCLPTGIYTLKCYNFPHVRGWKDTYLLIDGHRYCDNFIDYEFFQKIYVTGIKSINHLSKILC